MGLWLVLSGLVWLSTRSPGCPVAKKGKVLLPTTIFKIQDLLLMAEIPNNHLVCKNPTNNGKSYQPQLVRFRRISAINSIIIQKEFHSFTLFVNGGSMPTSRVKRHRCHAESTSQYSTPKELFDHILGRSWFKSMVP